MTNQSSHTQLKRNETLKLVRQSNRKINKIRYDQHETKNHRETKREICNQLEKQGKHYITEAIFETGGRADILVLDDFQVIEILHTEKIEELNKKKKAYPKGLRITYKQTK